jgi:hypothetical protein
MPAGRLATLMRAKFPGKYDQLPDAELEALVIAKYPQYRTVVEDTTTPTPPSPIPDPAGYESGAARLATAVRDIAVPKVSAETVIEALPTIGGAVGGTVGGLLGAPTVVGAIPSAVAGAALVGAAGESARQGLQTLRGRLKPRPPSEELTDIGKEAAIQGGLELAGGVAAPLLKAGATKLYRSALDMPASILNRFDPERLARRGLEEGISATRGGVPKAQAALKESGQESRRLAAAADVAGAPPATTTELMTGLEEPLQKAAAEWFPGQPLETLGKLEEDLAELEQAIREAGVRRSGAYKQAAELGGEPATRAAADVAMTDRARQILYERVPQIQAEKARAQELIGLTKALKAKKEATPIGLLDYLAGATGAGLGAFGGLAGVVGGAPLGIAAGRAVRSKAVKSGAARALYGSAPYQSQAYRALLALLRGGSPDEQNFPPEPQ